jgi:hypothetical protein
MQEVRTIYLPQLVDFDLHGDDAPHYIPVLQSLKDFIDKTYKRPEGMYSKVRKLIGAAISNAALLKKAREIIKQDKKSYDAERLAARLVSEHRNQRQTVISMEYINEVVQRLRDSDEFSHRVVLLMLACGARKIEILDGNTSYFCTIPNSWGIAQVGVAKRGAEDDTVVLKPLLFIQSTEFMTILEHVRVVVWSRNLSTREAIGKSFSHQLETLCSSLWPQNVGNGYRTGTHLNRAIYANVAYKKYGKPTESLTHFIKERLGHDSMGSAANYMNVAIAFPTDTHLLAEAEVQSWIIEDQKVALVSHKGEEKMFSPPPIRKMTAEQRDNEVHFYADLLRVQDVPVTRANLMALGLQSSFITSSGALIE